MDGVKPDAVLRHQGFRGHRRRALSLPAYYWRDGEYTECCSPASGNCKNIAERPKKGWLYNLAKDPTEQTNLAAAMPDKVAELQSALAVVDAEQVKPLWPTLLEAPDQIEPADGHTGRRPQGQRYLLGELKIVMARPLRGSIPVLAVAIATGEFRSPCLRALSQRRCSTATPSRRKSALRPTIGSQARARE